MTDPIITVDTDRHRTTISKEFAASADRVWRLWSEPDQLAQWWGPPGATTRVVRCDLRPGGLVDFAIVDATGARLRARWHVHVVEPPNRLVFEFDDSRVPRVDATVTITPRGDHRTHVELTIDFRTAAAMRTLDGWGFDRGLAAALARAAALERPQPD